MTNKIFYFFFIFIAPGCITTDHIKKNDAIQNRVEIRGHFYRHVPYQIFFPKRIDPNSIETISKYIYFEEKTYDRSSTIFQFSILEEINSSITFYDKYSQCSIAIKPNTTKHPPILVEMKLDKYYRSGDTISVVGVDKGGLAAGVINFDIDLRLSVKEFDLLTIQNGILITDTSKGPYLTSEQVKALKNREKNTPIIFTNIIVKSNNEDVKVDPLVFFVRDN